MYGWLDTSFCAVRAWFADTNERIVRTTPLALANWLPLLGSVLYVPPRVGVDADAQWPDGLLSETPLLAPMLHTRYLRVVGMVSADGPREWIDCLDTRGICCPTPIIWPGTTCRTTAPSSTNCHDRARCACFAALPCI
jgi:hypothetical protein